MRRCSRAAFLSTSNLQVTRGPLAAGFFFACVDIDILATLCYMYRLFCTSSAVE